MWDSISHILIYCQQLTDFAYFEHDLNFAQLDEQSLNYLRYSNDSVLYKPSETITSEVFVC